MTACGDNFVHKIKTTKENGIKQMTESLEKQHTSFSGETLTVINYLGCNVRCQCTCACLSICAETLLSLGNMTTLQMYKSYIGDIVNRHNKLVTKFKTICLLRVVCPRCTL